MWPSGSIENFSRKGAAINKTNKYGFTPLILAGYSGREEIIRYPNEISPDINIHNANKITVLHLAISILDA